jgi:hypothetical protein
VKITNELILKRGNTVRLKHQFMEDEGPYSFPKGSKGKFYCYDTQFVGRVIINDRAIGVPIKNLELGE